MTDLASSSAPATGQVVTGVLGFLVVAGMGVALYFLLRSMNKQLRKVVREPSWREEARQDEEPGGAGGPGGAGEGAGAGEGTDARPEQHYSRNGTGQHG